MQVKNCNSCNKEKTLENFSKKGKGLQSKCKDCKHQEVNDHYKNNKDYYKKKAMYYKMPS